MDKKEFEDYKKAGEIAKKVVAYAKEIIKPGMLLSEIAGKIHKKIEELNAVPAFPVNLAINDIAAHYHPSLEDETKAEGLLKVDIGVHFNGYIADTAFSMDLTPDKQHKELIKASEEALENALKKLEKNPDLTLNEIGKTIQETIENKQFSPIINLSGHSLDQYNLHAGTTIPNYANGNKNKLKEGAYAIEPFATTGEGRIYEGGSSNIFRIENPKTPRSPNARKILDYVWKKYKTLPFSLREVQEKFPGARIALKELEQQDIIKNYLQLIEASHKPVSQAEHTIIKTDKGIIVTTR
ncbi:MAG: type II methionyl aminopeptidase [Nanoarchaeota archaeon]|nr:type II methionyl aminopeptidase [Nanoarchaeota archaeon]